MFRKQKISKYSRPKIESKGGGKGDWTNAEDKGPRL